MNEKDLKFDRTKHLVYSRKVRECVRRLLQRYYDAEQAEALWEKIQLKYCEFLEEEPPLKDLKITASIYDPILLFAWYAVVPDKPPLEEIQQDVFDCFMGGFDALGRLFNLNRKLDNRLANLAFKSANDTRVREIEEHPESFRMGSYSYDKENGIVRYSFTQCPNAEFAKRHHMEDFLPVMCNCDHLAMQKLHAALIREGTCVTSKCCDYCIVGDQNPLAAKYNLVKNENGLLVSARKSPRSFQAI